MAGFRISRLHLTLRTTPSLNFATARVTLRHAQEGSPCRLSRVPPTISGEPRDVRHDAPPKERVTPPDRRVLFSYTQAHGSFVMNLQAFACTLR